MMSTHGLVYGCIMPKCLNDSLGRLTIVVNIRVIN